MQGAWHSSGQVTRPFAASSSAALSTTPVDSARHPPVRPGAQSCHALRGGQCRIENTRSANPHGALSKRASGLSGGEVGSARDTIPAVGDLLIQPERTADFAAIADLVRAAFGSETEVRLVESIRRSPGYLPELSLVAEDEDGRVVGHVMISHARLVDGDQERRVATLSPLAVVPERQGIGIGTALVREVTGRADALGEPLVVLEGNPAYYCRFGFESAMAAGIDVDLPEWAPPAAAQVLRLSGYRSEVRGRFVFDALTDAEADER